MMKVRDIMRTDLLKVSADASIVSVLRLHKDFAVSRLTYVVDNDGKLIGVVTIFDLLQKVLPDVAESAEFYKKLKSSDLAMKYMVKSIGNTKGEAVGDIMRKGMETVSPDDLFFKAHKLLVKKEVTAMPVVDAAGVPVGEITRRIIIKYIAEHV